MLGLGWEESRFSHYDIRPEGVLPPSITVIARVKNWAIGFEMFLLRELVPKYKYVCFEFLKVIVALILNGYFRNINWKRLLNSR